MNNKSASARLTMKMDEGCFFFVLKRNTQMANALAGKPTLKTMMYTTGRKIWVSLLFSTSTAVDVTDTPSLVSSPVKPLSKSESRQTDRYIYFRA